MHISRSGGSRITPQKGICLSRLARQLENHALATQEAQDGGAHQVVTPPQLYTTYCPPTAFLSSLQSWTCLAGQRPAQTRASCAQTARWLLSGRQKSGLSGVAAAVPPLGRWRVCVCGLLPAVSQPGGDRGRRRRHKPDGPGAPAPRAPKKKHHQCQPTSAARGNPN